MRARHYAFMAISSPPSVWLTNAVAQHLCGDLIRNRGRLINTSGPAISAWVRTLIFWGAYETAELRLIERYLPKDMDVIELGGSIGVVAAQIAGHLSRGAKFISVEANPRLIHTLTTNILANNLHSDARVVHAAVSYDCTSDHVGLRFGDSSLVSWVRNPDDKTSQVKVPRTTLSELVQKNNIDGSYALVADIEGAEAGMLAHDAALDRCSIMIVELHDATLNGRRITVSDLVTTAKSRGFNLIDFYRDSYVFRRPN